MMAAMTLPPLNATAIVDALSVSAAAMFAVEVYDSVGSTNDVARAFLLADGSPSADGFRSVAALAEEQTQGRGCLLYTSPSPRDMTGSRMPSSA